MWFAPPNQQIFSRFCILRRILGNFEDFVIFCLFIWPSGIPLKRQCFSGQYPWDLLVFWLWFSPPSEKIFRNLCIRKKICRLSERSALLVCSKATKEHAVSGWCAAVIFWKKSTRFAGFLVVIFISQRKKLQQFMHSEQILEISLPSPSQWWVMMSNDEWWMLTMLMMGADDDADDRENYINKLPNSRSTARGRRILVVVYYYYYYYNKDNNNNSYYDV